MQARFHCGEVMEYLGKKEKEHCFECSVCQAREYTLDPDKSTTPEEKPRKKMTDFGNWTKMGKPFR